MNKKNGISESKPRQSQRQGESAPELSVGRAYVVEPLTVGKVLILTSFYTFPALIMFCPCFTIFVMKEHFHI